LHARKNSSSRQAAREVPRKKVPDTFFSRGGEEVNGVEAEEETRRNGVLAHHGEAERVPAGGQIERAEVQRVRRAEAAGVEVEIPSGRLAVGAE